MNPYLKKPLKCLYKRRIFFIIFNYFYNLYHTSKWLNPAYRHYKIKRLDKEVGKFFEKLYRGENFAFVRNADGERAFMLGKSVESQEKKWTSPNYVSKLGESILESLDVEDEQFYYAISCPCCDKEAFFWYYSRIKSPNITFSNLWINVNFRHFRENFERLRRDCVLIANYRAKILLGNGAKLGNLRILKLYEISDDCVSFWEDSAPGMLAGIKRDFGEAQNLLFVVSAGPMSSPIIKDLWTHNPNNCYVDFGSAVDGYYVSTQTRPYQDKYSIYGSRNCVMYDGLKADISVVLTLHKRAFALERQVEAILSQSIKPKELILFVDTPARDSTNSANMQDSKGTQEARNLTDSTQSSDFPNHANPKDSSDSNNSTDSTAPDSAHDPLSLLPQSLKNRFDNIIHSRENVGVWGRFSAALLAKGEFVAIFDDDTIPAPRYLESCLCENLAQEGCYGAIGIISNDLSAYPFGKYHKVGWEHNPPHSRHNKRRVEVDFLGHSWFVRSDYLAVMWLGTGKMYRFKNVAEDMTLSYALRRHLGVKSFVPPHANAECFGSVDGLNLGKSRAAISTNAANLAKMNAAIRILKHEYKMREIGFSPLWAVAYLAQSSLKKLAKNEAQWEKIKAFVRRFIR